MNRRYYKKGLCVSMSVLFLLLSACGPQPQQGGDPGDLGWEQKFTFSMSSDCTEEGYYYYKDRQYLSYFDFSSKQNVILCGKIGCEHKDKTCDAYVQSPVYLCCFSEALYIVEREDNAYQLTKRAKDGTNYETITNLMEEKIPADGGGIELSMFMASGDKLYFLGKTLDTAWKQDSANQAFLYSADLKSGEQTLLYEVPKDRTCKLQAVNERQVIFYEVERNGLPPADDADDYEQKSFLESRHMQVKLLDTRNQSVKVLTEDNRYRMLGPAAVDQNHLYLIMWDESHQKHRLERLNMDTGERQEVLPALEEYKDVVVLDSGELMLLANEKWSRYSLKDFKERRTDFLPPTGMISESGKDGYIVDYFSEDSGKRTYSYITMKDANEGRQAYSVFYIENENS